MGALFLCVILGSFVLAGFAQGMEGWTGPLDPPRLGTDGMSWKVRHLQRGMVWSRFVWGALMLMGTAPLLGILGAVAFPALSLQGLLLGSVAVVLGPYLLLGPLVASRLGQGELRATPEGLHWVRAWPEQSLSWTWKELRQVRCRPEALYLDRVAGGTLRVALPGAPWEDLRTVCEVLEATRAAPPLAPGAVPEMPAALRALMQRGAER